MNQTINMTNIIYIIAIILLNRDSLVIFVYEKQESEYHENARNYQRDVHQITFYYILIRNTSSLLQFSTIIYCLLFLNHFRKGAYSAKKSVSISTELYEIHMTELYEIHII